MRQFLWEWKSFGFRIALGNTLLLKGGDILGTCHTHVCYPDEPCQDHLEFVSG